MLDVAQVLAQAGGVAPARALVRATSRRRVRTAVARGEVVRAARGHYRLPEIDGALVAAADLCGTLSHLSAALHHGWPVKQAPALPQVVVPRGRNVDHRRRRGVELRWADVPGAERAGPATAPVRTVLDCARALPFDEALAVADSALRAGDVTRTELLLALAGSPRNGRTRAYRVVELADARAANPFESVLRAILVDVPGAAFTPQVRIGSIGRPDLVDVDRRIVVEADSVEFHASPAAFARDMERYNALVAEGWAVLRFGWVHAMFEPDYVRAVVAAVVDERGPGGRSTRAVVPARAA